MQTPIEISFRGMDPSPAVEQRVREKIAKLESFHNHITGCRVVIELPNVKHQKGNLFQVRVDLEVSGKLLVADRSPVKDHGHEDCYIAIRDAFRAIRRQLQDYVRVRRGEVKVHEEGPSYGRVVRLFPYEGYGFMASADGRELYFHKNSVLNEAFDKLEVGFEVRYSEEAGDEGPQASTVALAGKQQARDEWDALDEEEEEDARELGGRSDAAGSHDFGQISHPGIPPSASSGAVL